MTLGVGSDQTDHAITVLYAFYWYGSALRRFHMQGALSPHLVRQNQMAWMPSAEYLAAMAEEYGGQETKPPILPITKVRDRLHDVLAVLAVNLRSQLRRERQQVPVGLVQSLDARCIEWLVRQPGRDLRERAGPQQRILAIVRDSTFDTYENRILKLCLQLIDQGVREYEIAFGSKYREHVQFKELLAFGVLSRELLVLPALRDLPTPADCSKPNYVLQYGRRYSDVWWAFEQLMAQRVQEDEVWKWRHRICGEVVAIDFALAISRLHGVRPLESDREIGVRSSPLAGQWIHFSSRFPTRVVERAGSHIEVSMRLPLHAPLAEHDLPSADLIVTVRSLKDATSCSLPVSAIASGLDESVARPCHGTSRLVVQQGGPTIRTVRGIDSLPHLSVGSFWPLDPSERVLAAEQVLERIIEHVAKGGAR